MKELKYKVEAFIIPVGNNYNINNVNESTIMSTEENKFSQTQGFQNDSFSVEKENLQNVEHCSTRETVAEAKIDVSDTNNEGAINFCSSLNVSPIKCKKLADEDNVCGSTKVIHKVHKLIPIIERHENNEIEYTDLCYHGCKNGCSATVPTPEEVSENIFKESWLQKLEDINRRELILRNREVNLLNREEALLEKQKELEVLEHALKIRLQQVDLEIKERNHLNVFHVDNINADKNLAPPTDVNSKEIRDDNSDINSASEEELNNLDINKMDLRTKITETRDTLHQHKCTQDVEIVSKDLCEQKTNFLSLPPSLSNVLTEKRMKQLTNTRSYVTSKSARVRSTYSNNNRAKRSCKVYYEDLDTTLSADIGDSSFLPTSQKFDPAVYKKPYAFRRATSERHVRCINRKSITNLEVENFGCPDEKVLKPTEIEQDKVLKKVTQNIFASQDRNTKYQHYGLIDENVDAVNKYNLENEKNYSYLNLETSNKSCYQKVPKGLSGRPVSWNEQTNEWLQKKRKAYNMTMKKECSDSKEDLEFNTATKDRIERTLKKKDLKTKIFTLFR